MKAHISDKRKAKQEAKFEKRVPELMRRPRGVDSDEDTDSENEEVELRRVMRASRQSFMEEQIAGSSRRMGAGPSSTKKSCDIRPPPSSRTTSVARMVLLHKRSKA